MPRWLWAPEFRLQAPFPTIQRRKSGASVRPFSQRPLSVYREIVTTRILQKIDKDGQSVSLSTNNGPCWTTSDNREVPFNSFDSGGRGLLTTICSYRR
jgi:hypothetical protein